MMGELLPLCCCPNPHLSVECWKAPWAIEDAIIPKGLVVWENKITMSNKK